MRGSHAIDGAESVYLPDSAEQRLVRVCSMPFVDSSKRSAGLVIVKDMEPERRAQECYQQRFIETLVATIRSSTYAGIEAHEAHNDIVRTMGFNVQQMTRTDGLSPHEEEVLRLMARGASRKEIGSRLSIAVKTVEFHRSSAARKLALKSRVDVVSYAIDRGWITNGG